MYVWYNVWMMLGCSIQCFDAVSWATGRASSLLKTEWWGAGVIICLDWSEVQTNNMAQLMPLPLTVSCFSKIQIAFSFLVPAYRVVPDKGPLNGCVWCWVVSVHCSWLNLTERECCHYADWEGVEFHLQWCAGSSWEVSDTSSWCWGIKSVLLQDVSHLCFGLSDVCVFSLLL